MKKIDKNKECEIIAYYNSGKSMKDCGEYFNLSITTIFNVLNRNNVPKRTKGGIYKLPEDEIISLYRDGKSSFDIASIYKVTQGTIIGILKTNNIPRDNRYHNLNLDVDYFSNIDSIDKAYFLGFMIADGNVNGDNNMVSLSLSNKDKYILEIFSDVTHSSNKLYSRKDKPETTFRLKNHKWVSDLSKYGVVPRKTFTSYLPTISDEFMPHMIRGLIDGDGWISYMSHQLGFCGNEIIVTEVRDFLVNRLDVYNVSVIHPRDNLYQITWASKKDIQVICEYLYNNKKRYYLQRKYNNYLAIYGNTEVSS